MVEVRKKKIYDEYVLKRIERRKKHFSNTSGPKEVWSSIGLTSNVSPFAFIRDRDRKIERERERERERE